MLQEDAWRLVELVSQLMAMGVVKFSRLEIVSSHGDLPGVVLLIPRILLDSLGLLILHENAGMS